MNDAVALPLTASAGTVLLVAAEAVDEAAAERALNVLGFEVVIAPDGLGALKAFRASPSRYSLVLLDLDLPDLDGLETRQALLDLRPETRILLSSSAPVEVALQHTHLSPARVAFVQKPYRGEELARRVWEALAG